MSSQPVKRISAGQQKKPQKLLAISLDEMEKGLAEHGYRTGGDDLFNPFLVIPQSSKVNASKVEDQIFDITEEIRHLKCLPGGSYAVVSREKMPLLKKHFQIRTVNFEQLLKAKASVSQDLAMRNKPLTQRLELITR